MSTTLVFGASLNPTRYSNIAIHRLVQKNIPTKAFGIAPGIISNVRINTNLGDLENIHTITLYINDKVQKDYYQSILALKPKRVIFNPGTENPEFYALLRLAGVKVEVACTLVLLATNQY